METESPRSPRYKHTRELVRIALQEDMTQAEIARLCRTTQSVVSDWATGKKKAPENVIKPLLDRYGHRLRRASFRLYLVQLLPEIPWEQTDTGKLVLQLSQDPAGYVRERLSAEEWDAWVRPHVRRKWLPEVAAALSARNLERMRLDEPMDPAPADKGQRRKVRTPLPADENNPMEADLLPITESDLKETAQRLNWGDHPLVSSAWAELGCESWHSRRGLDPAELAEADFLRRYQRLVRVEGAPLWRHVIGEPKAKLSYLGRTEIKDIVMEPKARLLVHPAEAGQFWLIGQDRRHLTGWEYGKWVGQKMDIGRADSEVSDKGEVRSEDDVARWIGAVQGPLSLPELLVAVEKHLEDAGPHDRAVVPFTLRKALVEHGYVLDDILSPHQVNPSKNNTIPKVVP